MSKIELSKDDAAFLKDLQRELLTQTNDGNALPVFWGVMETRTEPAPEGCGDARIFVGDSEVSFDRMYSTFNEAFDAVKKYGRDLDKEEREKTVDIYLYDLAPAKSNYIPIADPVCGWDAMCVDETNMEDKR